MATYIKLFIELQELELYIANTSMQIYWNFPKLFQGNYAVTSGTKQGLVPSKKLKNLRRSLVYCCGLGAEACAMLLLRSDEYVHESR